MEFYEKVIVTYADGIRAEFNNVGMARSRTERYIIISFGIDTLYISTEEIRAVRTSKFVTTDE